MIWAGYENMAIPRRKLTSLVGLFLLFLIIFSCCLENVESARAGKGQGRGRGSKSGRGGRGRGGARRAPARIAANAAVPGATINFEIVEPDEKVFNIIQFRNAVATPVDDYEAGPGEEDITPDGVNLFS